jgi:hypothetical protein
MMDSLERARQMRRAVELWARDAGDEQAAQIPSLFPAWTDGAAYDAGDRAQYLGLVYKCLTAHTAQADWTPGLAPSLWVRIDDPAVEWPAWRQPVGAHDAYPEGAKVAHNGMRWVSLTDANVWEPGAPGVTQWALA